MGMQPHARARPAPPSAVSSCPAGAIVIQPGTAIQAVVDAAEEGAQFCIATGTHRLQSVTPKPGQRFFGEAGSVLNGAQVLTDFKPEGGQWIGAAEEPIGEEHGVCAAGHATCSRPAGLFVDGRPLQRTASRLGLRPDQFFFDPAAHQLVVATDPTGRLVEWATARHAFAGAVEDVWITGLVIEKYAAPAQEGAVWPGGRGWKIIRVQARLNNGVGLVGGTDGLIEDCDVHHNGQLGIGAGGATNLVISNNRVWANNINGFDDEWEAGGIKVAQSRDVVFRNNQIHDNAGPGLWCDEDCRDVLIEGNVVASNASAGIFYEISSDAMIRDNILVQNGAVGHAWVWAAEIQVAASGNVTVIGNTMTVRPNGKAVMLIDQNRQRVDGRYYQTRDNRVEGNRTTFLGDGLAGGASDADPSAANYEIIQKGANRFDRNIYRVQPGRTPRFVWGAGLIDLAAFRRQGEEGHGTLSKLPAPRGSSPERRLRSASLEGTQATPK